MMAVGSFDRKTHRATSLGEVGRGAWLGSGLGLGLGLRLGLLLGVRVRGRVRVIVRGKG